MKKKYSVNFIIFCLLLITSNFIYSMEEKEKEKDKKTISTGQEIILHANNASNNNAQNDDNDDPSQLPQFIWDTLYNNPSPSPFDNLASLDEETLQFLLKQNLHHAHFPYGRDDNSEGTNNEDNIYEIPSNRTTNNPFDIHKAKKSLKSLKIGIVKLDQRLSRLYKKHQKFILHTREGYLKFFGTQFASSVTEGIKKMALDALIHKSSEFLENTEIKYLYGIDLYTVKRKLAIFSIAEGFENVQDAQELLDNNEKVIMAKYLNLIKRYSQIASNNNNAR